MIRSPLGLRIDPDPARSPREQFREAARLGARGIVFDAAGELAPERLSETGRREIRYLLRSVELGLVALSLPTRRPFDSIEGLDDRLARAERAFAMAYELGTNLVLARIGGVPPEGDAGRRGAFTTALTELARRADRHGVRLAIETGSEAGSVLAGVLTEREAPSLAASIDPAALQRMGHDPATAVRELAGWVAHAYANELSGPGGRALDWAEYLGSLEEIDYRGYLTVWPGPTASFTEIKARLDWF
jgi:sugar phosphate isomerase/epimerase